MKRAIGMTAALALMLSMAPPAAMADHYGHGGWHGGGGYAPWWIIPPLVLLATLPAYDRYPVYDPPIVVQQPPPTVVVQQPPAAPAMPPAQVMASPPVQYYYCESAKGYYPYVPSCPSGWTQVPATPADMPR
jgi:hypothetical protein